MQGGETDEVLVIIPNDSHFMLSREWLLTSITRAKKHCTIISSVGSAYKICKKSALNKRVTLTTLQGELNDSH